ncbi:MAG TPA: AAA family ATPase [Stellaceae bacterium]|nr:AAA family ATPase [Stellaceae bacterium]
MYASFYGFRTEPFHVTPDASLVFLTAAHREAIGVLEYGLRVRKGFIVISGEVGVGKTTVLRHSLRRLDPANSAIVYVLQPALTPHQLLTFIWEELSGEADPMPQPWAADTGELIRRLLFRLKQLHTQGKLIVIVIDEAQNMPVETLESLRLLSNLENDKQKFIQIVLAGQPELDEKLARHELRQLNQRIAVRTRIGNLTPLEALSYVDFRIQAASGRHLEVFTHDALDYIVARAGGNPRRLNIFCDNALINGMGHRAPVVTREIAREAVEPHLSENERGSFPTLPAWMTQEQPRSGNLPFALAAAAAAALLAIYLGTDWFSAAPPPRLVAQPHPAAAQVAILPRGEQPVPDVAPAHDMLIAAPAQPSPPPVATYRIENQDSLGQLCQLVYGICSRNMVQKLAKANPTVDPDKLIAGQTVYLPVIENLKPVVP